MKPDTLKICEQYLFKEVPESMAEQQRHRIQRIQKAFVFWHEQPQKKEKEVLRYLMTTSGVKRSQAYEDISILKTLLGNIQDVSKEWHRRRFIDMIEDTFKKAKKLDDAKAMAMAADKYAKYTNLDKEDPDPIPWDQIVPPTWEPTDDPTVIGLKKNPKIRQRVAEMKRKYNEEIDITEAQILDDEPED